MNRKLMPVFFVLIGLMMFAFGIAAVASPAGTGSSSADNSGIDYSSYNTVITVESGEDLDTSGSGITDGQPATLRRAINSARTSPKPVLIEFDIPKSCPSFVENHGGLWKIELLGIGTGAPANTTFRQLNGDITIDGSTQTGRENGPTIILYGEGFTGARNCLVLGESATQGGNVIKGLGFQNFRDSITVSSVNNTIEDCWFGLNDEGTEPELRGGNPASGSGYNGVVLSNIAAEGNNMIQRNIFLGLSGTAATIRGWDNTFQNNLIGLAADGTVSNPGCTPDSWLGGGGIVVQDRRHTIENNRFAGLRFDQFDESQPPDAIRVTAGDWANAGHNVVGNNIGLDVYGNPVGTCGRGITLNNHMRGTLVENNTIVDTALAGIFLNGGVYNQCELRSNILKGTTIEYGEGLPEEFAEYLPAKVTSIDGTSVSGTSGDGSPGPNNKIELFLDNTNAPEEALESLAIVTADGDGNWEATLDAPLSDGEGIRTTSTTMQFGIIENILTGTTTGLSELYSSTEAIQPDHTSLLYWQHEDGSLKAWLMDGASQIQNSPLTPASIDPGWQAKAIADMNGDGHPDIYWLHEDGSLKVWLMEGLEHVDTVRPKNPATGQPQISPVWDMMAVADLNGSGDPDIIWQALEGDREGRLAIWLMDGLEADRFGQLYNHPGVSSVSPLWEIGAVYDLLGNGSPEVIWQSVSGEDFDQLAYWELDVSGDEFSRSGSGRLTQVGGSATIRSQWRMRTAVDLLDDGKFEILFQGISGAQNGRVSYWEMVGIERTDGGPLNPNSVDDPDWRLVGSSN